MSRISGHLFTSSEPRIKANILVVDDTPANRMVFEAVLGALDHNVVLASSGQEALRLAMHQEFAVILLDVRMPGMDGFETAELLRGREKTRYTPILFMSAHEASPVQISKAYDAGAVDYLFSPVNPDILSAKVKAFVDLWKRNQALSRRAEELVRINETLQAQLAASQGLDDLKAIAHALNQALLKLQDDTPYLRFRRAN